MVFWRLMVEAADKIRGLAPNDILLFRYADLWPLLETIEHLIL
jgi:hypothetical protein